MSDLIKTLRQEALQENAGHLAEYLDEDYRTQAADLIEQQRARISDLEQLLRDSAKAADQFYQQRNHAIEKCYELAATVERLRGVERDETCYGQIIMEILDTTPHQNLNSLKREAYEQGFLDGFNGGLEIDKKNFIETFDSPGAIDLVEQQKRHLAKLHGYRYAEHVKRGEE